MTACGALKAVDLALLGIGLTLHVCLCIGGIVWLVRLYRLIARVERGEPP